MQQEGVGGFRISPQQEQLWLEQPDGPTGRVQAVVELEGALDEAALADALAQVVGRHEILRTTFVRRPGIRVPFQVVHDELAPLWEPATDLDATVRDELLAPLDLEHGPLLRARLVTTELRRQCLSEECVSPMLRRQSSAARRREREEKSESPTLHDEGIYT